MWVWVLEPAHLGWSLRFSTAMWCWPRHLTFLYLPFQYVESRGSWHSYLPHWVAVRVKWVNISRADTQTTWRGAGLLPPLTSSLFLFLGFLSSQLNWQVVVAISYCTLRASLWYMDSRLFTYDISRVDLTRCLVSVFSFLVSIFNYHDCGTFSITTTPHTHTHKPSDFTVVSYPLLLHSSEFVRVPAQPFVS